MAIGSILDRLQRDEIILPYFEASMLRDDWPDKYSIEIDSSPYYGLTDEDGVSHDSGAGDGYFHPSTHALMKERELYNRFHPELSKLVPAERRNMTSLMTLAMGSAIHAVVQTQFVMAGLMKPEKAEYEFLNKSRGIRGRLDMVVDHPRYGLLPVEVKTQNHYNFANQYEIKPVWDAQLSVGMTETGFSLGVLLLIEAGWPYRMREFAVRRNDVLVSEIYGKWERVREALALDIPPRCACPLGSAAAKKCVSNVACWGESS
jgi:hypothetical protein